MARVKPVIKLTVWKDICLVPGCEVFTNYEISSTALVRIKTTGLFRSVTIGNHGYANITLSHSPHKKKTVCLHRILALLFKPNPENYPCVDHENGIKTDNRIGNLRWCTNSQNIMNSRSKHGKSGYKNIYISENPGPVWQIAISTKGKYKRKYFKRETEEVPQHVIECRDKMLKDLHKDFACFRI